MSDRPDERLPTSDEMIREAREHLADRPEVSELHIDRDQIAQQVEHEMPSARELIRSDRPRSRPERVVRASQAPPRGFGDEHVGSQTAVALGVALALLILGIVAFVALAASGT